MASLEGVVHDLCDEGTHGMKVVFYQGCGEGVQGTGGWFHLFDDVLKLSL